MKLLADVNRQGALMEYSRLDIEWDESLGIVTGDGADVINRLSTSRYIDAHPHPFTWTLSDSPLKSRTDMAAIIGCYWQLPAELAPYYPKPIEQEAGNVNVIY